LAWVTLIRSQCLQKLFLVIRRCRRCFCLTNMISWTITLPSILQEISLQTLRQQRITLFVQNLLRVGMKGQKMQ
jgi:hypothetical protein